MTIVKYLSLFFCFTFFSAAPAIACEYTCSAQESVINGPFHIIITTTGDCDALEPQNLQQNRQIVDDCAAKMLKERSIINQIVRCNGTPDNPGQCFAY